MPRRLKAISLRQPWAEEIMLGIKTIEYRRTPTKVRGPIYIYASLGRVDPEAENLFAESWKAIAPLVDMVLEE